MERAGCGPNNTLLVGVLLIVKIGEIAYVGLIGLGDGILLTDSVLKH